MCATLGIIEILPARELVIDFGQCLPHGPGAPLLRRTFDSVGRMQQSCIQVLVVIYDDVIVWCPLFRRDSDLP